MNYPAQPQYPTFPQQPGQPQQFAPQPPPQQYAPPQGYPVQPQQYAPPVGQQPEPVQGTLDDFYNQPSSGGGPSLKFATPGTRYVGIVSRPIGQGDVQQQTDTMGQPQTFKDGRPKFVMKVPLQMQPSAEYPDGQAQWYVKGAVRDELSRAMAEANAPAGAPEAGAVIDITFTNERPAGVGMNPAKVFAVRYTRPDGAGAPSPAPEPQGQVQHQPPVAQQPVQQPAQPQVQPQGQVYGHVDQVPAVQQAPAQQYQPAPQQPAQPQVQAPTQQGAPQPPSDLSPEQQQLLARLQG